MNKKIIFVFLFCILLVGGLYYYYSNFEPKKTQQFNLSISAIDKGRIKTGYELIELNIKGNTSNTYEQLTLTQGVYTIKNINLKNQKYYQTNKTVNLTKNTRVDFILEKPEIPEIKKETTKKNIILNIYSNNFQEVDFCLLGSINYLFLRAEPRTMKFFKLTNKKENISVRTDKYDYSDYPDFHIIETFEQDVEYTEINKKGFENYDICYDGEFSLKDNNKILNISYMKLSTTNENDFINITLIDKAGNQLNERIK